MEITIPLIYDFLFKGIAFLVVLSVLVLIHEFGHFITAKKFGIKVEEFGFGFPPRMLGIKRGETIYSINWLPIGGFVKLYGEDDAGGGSVRKKMEVPKTDLNRAFFARPAWQRATIVLAGVVMNFVLAVVIISYLFAGPGVKLPSKNITIDEIAAGSPAAAAGLAPRDEVISVNGQNITSTEKFISITHKSEGKPLSLKVMRGGEVMNFEITPRTVVPKGEGPLGVAISNVKVLKYPWYQAPFYGTLEAFKFSWMILAGLGDMIVKLATERAAPAGVAGPIGVAILTGEAVSYGPVAILWFVALLSLNLAVVNVLPIPALDGGRLFFIMVELITRKKVPQKYETMSHAVGLVVLLALILLITGFDIFRIITGQSLFPKM